MRIVKRAVDVCMTVLLLCLMAYQVTGETLHEWCGIGMTVLLIVHHILNRKWTAALFKGKYGAYRTVSAAVNALLAGCDVLLIPPDLPAAYAAVLRAVREGVLTEERLDRSVSRILRCKALAGLL